MAPSTGLVSRAGLTGWVIVFFEIRPAGFVSYQGNILSNAIVISGTIPIV